MRLFSSFAGLLLLVFQYFGFVGAAFPASKTTSANVIMVSGQPSRRNCLKNIPFGLQRVSTIRGGAFGDWDASELVSSSNDWCVNLGAPAALVAGAVIASIYEFDKEENLELSKNDGKVITLLKKLTKILLVSAFALEVLSIFVTTVTGTVLLNHTVEEMAKIKVTPNTTPMTFLRDNFEFEYLTARLTFLLGLLNWLSAIALHFAIPKEGETPANRAMDKVISSMLSTVIVLMVSFYNTHVTYYDNLWNMIVRFKMLIVQNYLLAWPPKPLSFVLVPCVGSVVYFVFQSFFCLSP